MSILSGLKKAATSAVKSVASTVSSTTKAVTTAAKSFIASQPARAENVVQTVKAAVTLQGVKADTGNKAVDKVLSAAASNPYTTAAAVAVGAAPKAAASLVSSAASSVSKAFSGASLGTKAAVVVAAPVVAATVIKNPSTVSKTASAYTKTVDFASDVLSGKNIIESTKENPVGAAITGAGLVAATALATKGLGTYIETKKQTAAFQEQTELMKESLKQSQQQITSTGIPLTSISSQFPSTSGETLKTIPEAVAPDKAVVPVSNNIAREGTKTPAKKRKVYKKQPQYTPFMNRIYNNVNIAVRA